MRIIRYTLIALLVILWVTLARTAEPSAPPYQPTEMQSLRLQLKQRDAQLAQRDLQAAQVRFQQALADLTAEGNKVKADNHWPNSVSFNPNDLTFALPTPAPAAPAAKKPGPKP